MAVSLYASTATASASITLTTAPTDAFLFITATLLTGQTASTPQIDASSSGVTSITTVDDGVNMKVLAWYKKGLSGASHTVSVSTGGNLQYFSASSFADVDQSFDPSTHYAAGQAATETPTTPGAGDMIVAVASGINFKGSPNITYNGTRDHHLGATAPDVAVGHRAAGASGSTFSGADSFCHIALTMVGTAASPDRPQVRISIPVAIQRASSF